MHNKYGKKDYNMPSNERERISEIIREQIDSFEFRKPCITRGHESLISNEISYDQAVNDAIHDFIEDLAEFGMAAHYVDITSRGIHIRPINPNAMHAVMPAVISGLKHDIVIIDDEYQPKYIDPELEHEKPFPINVVPFYPRNYASKQCLELVDGILFQELKTQKENHPYGWYRKFEKKRF